MLEATISIMPTTPYRVPLRVLIFQWLKDHKITMRQAAERTGYKVSYLRNIKSGSSDLTDGFKWKLAAAIPEIRDVLFEADAAETTGAAGEDTPDLID